MLWITALASEAKIADICGSGHDPDRFALCIERRIITARTAGLACEGLFDKEIKSFLLALLCSLA